jgi:hypothetical protein
MAFNPKLKLGENERVEFRHSLGGGSVRSDPF